MGSGKATATRTRERQVNRRRAEQSREQRSPQELAIKPTNAQPLGSRPPPCTSSLGGGDKPIGLAATTRAAGGASVDAEFEKGESVMLEGLERAPHLNGRAATVPVHLAPLRARALRQPFQPGSGVGGRNGAGGAAGRAAVGRPPRPRRRGAAPCALGLHGIQLGVRVWRSASQSRAYTAPPCCTAAAATECVRRLCQRGGG